MNSKRFFCVTIDVEPDCQTDWRRSDPLRFGNVVEGIPNILTPLFERYGVRPTYLLSPEVMDDARAVDVLKRVPNAELGTHLHAEYCEPERVYEDAAGTASLTFPSALSDEILAGKIRNITEQFQRAFRQAPAVYRAARFGADERTWRGLGELGYTVDTSVTPGIDWTSKGGPDFSREPDQPRRVDGGVLEVPVTIAPGILSKMMPGQWFAWRWLRPSVMTAWGMRRLIDDMIGKHPDRVCLNMMFHSMEVIPGASPYVRSERGRRAFLKRLEAVLAYAQRCGCRFVHAGDLAHEWA